MFQRAMDFLLAKVKWQFALVYLDDIVIFSRTQDEHIAHARQLLTLLHDAGVTLNLKNAKFYGSHSSYWPCYSRRAPPSIMTHD